MVSELIEGDLKWWNGRMLESLFTPHEIQLIQTLAPSSTNQLDVLIWRGTTSGKFTVKSAYYMQQDLNNSGVAACLDVVSNNFWKKLWALPIPKTEKNFL